MLLVPPVATYTHVVAAVIGGSGFTGDEIGTWAVGSVTGGGSIIALDSLAREFSSWGSAARLGSGADRLRQQIEDAPATDEAKDCVG